MKSVKRLGAWMLALILAVQLIPAASAGNLTSDRAKSYLQIVNSRPDANSYLVDFGGDGADELLITWQSGGEKTEYEVYSASSRVAADSVINEHASLGLYRKSGASGEYIGIDFGIGDSSSLTSFTLSRGKWSQIDNISEGWIGVKQTCKINGKEVSVEEYKKAESAYSQTLSLNHNAPYSSVKSQLVSAIDTSSPNHKDVLSNLTASEKKALFEDLLAPFAAHPLDNRTATDKQVVQIMNNVWSDYDKRYVFPFDVKMSDAHPGLSKAKLDALTIQLFGRTIDLSQFARASEPPWDDVDNYCYSYQNALYFHQYHGKGSFPGDVKVSPRHLYDLGKGYYFASLREEWVEDGTTSPVNTYLYSFIIKKNADSSYRLIRTYAENTSPTEAELNAYAQPSTWAKAEVEAADAAGLIPALTGDPAYQDTATRLQFAQLTVQYVEKLLGKTLPAAPSGTFTDCKDIAVLKAYQAGLVNGTSDTAFSPGQTLTREQLATMLWRTIVYLQAETGKNVYTKPGSLSGFSDKTQVSSWAVDGVGRLAANGIMKGTSDATLSPKASCTVEQSVLLVYRLYTAMQ